MSSINEGDAGAAGAIVSEEDASIIARGLEVLRKRELLAMKDAEELVIYVVLGALQEYHDALERYERFLSVGESEKMETINRAVIEAAENADVGALNELIRDMTETTERVKAATRAARSSFCVALAPILARMSEAAAKLSAYEVWVVSPELCDKLGNFQRQANEWLTDIQVALDNEKKELEGSDHSDVGRQD